MEDEIQCHGQLDGGIWLLLYWGWCKCRYKKQTVASLLQLVLALLGRCAMWVCGKLECLLLLRSASSSDLPPTNALDVEAEDKGTNSYRSYDH